MTNTGELIEGLAIDSKVTILSGGQAMRNKEVFHELILSVTQGMHETRREALAAVVAAAVDGQCLTVTGLGRAITREAREKHNIKRADRLLSNGHLQGECMEIYGAMARRLVGGQKHPVVVVDWSDLDPLKTHQLLRASLVVAGRALTLYEEVHDKLTALKAATHVKFVQRLSTMLPVSCRPVVVTDAGFHPPWFAAIEAQGWWWIGRIRQDPWVRLEGKSQWQSARQLSACARARPVSFGEVESTQKRAHRCRLVMYKGKPKGRHQLTRLGERARNAVSTKHAAGAREPWLLATNLPVTYHLASKVVRIYRARMQIEEAFRDVKSPRFGLALEYHRTTTARRLAVLMLIGALALLGLWLIGTIAHAKGSQRHYQANTVRSHLVLSVIFLALRVCGRNRDRFTAEEIAAAWRHITILNSACWGDHD